MASVFSWGMTNVRMGTAGRYLLTKLAVPPAEEEDNGDAMMLERRRDQMAQPSKKKGEITKSGLASPVNTCSLNQLLPLQGKQQHHTALPKEKRMA